MNKDIEGKFSVVPAATSVTLTELAESLGYDGELSVNALMVELGVYKRRTAEDCLALGMRFLLLKEMTKHGEFSKRIKQIGFSESTARRFMRAVKKTSQNVQLDVLNKAAPSVRDVLELVTDDSDDDNFLENLEDADEIDCMPPSVVRQNLREIKSLSPNEISLERLQANPAIVALKEQISARDGKINDLEANVKELSLRDERLSTQLAKAQQFVTIQPIKKRLSVFTPRTEEIRAECLVLQKESELAINGIRKLFESVNLDPHVPEFQLQIEQVWLAASITAARAADALYFLRDICAIGELPDSVMSPHMMTAAEAAHWLVEAQSIESAHEAKKFMREQQHAAAQPKGPGRPRKFEGSAK